MHGPLLRGPTHGTCLDPNPKAQTLQRVQEPPRPPPTALDALRAVLLGGLSFLAFMVLFVGGSYYARRQVWACKYQSHMAVEHVQPCTLVEQAVLPYDAREGRCSNAAGAAPIARCCGVACSLGRPS